MTVELSPEELQIIQDWYLASAGESAHRASGLLFLLLEKLHISAHQQDLYLRDPLHVRAEYRPEIEAQNKAIEEYRLRHSTCDVEAEERIWGPIQ